LQATRDPNKLKRPLWIVLLKDTGWKLERIYETNDEGEQERTIMIEAKK
jgi:hypothetical protein